MSNDELLQIISEQSRAIGRIEGHLEKLVGNGQPGLIKELQNDVDSLKDSRSHMRGYLAGVTGVIGVGEILFHYFGKKLGIRP
jgi:hypothetical protein